MILTCSSCHTRFMIGAAKLAPDGRTVRCSKCQNSWFQQPLGDDAEAVPSLPPEPSMAAPVGDELVEAALASINERAEALPLRAERMGVQATGTARRRQRRRRMVAAVATLAATIALVVGLRGTVTAHWPASSRLYAMAGLGPDDSAAEFSIRNLSARIETAENGDEVLVLTGEIVNVSNQVRAIPPIEAILRGDDGGALARWTFLATDVNVIPNEVINFTTKYLSPPPAAVGTGLNFASAE